MGLMDGDQQAEAAAEEAAEKAEAASKAAAKELREEQRVARQDAREATRLARLAARAEAQEADHPTHTVVSGDTLSAIGAKYGVSYQAIAKLNHIEDPDLIYPGQVFKIPPH